MKESDDKGAKRRENEGVKEEGGEREGGRLLYGGGTRGGYKAPSMIDT